MQLFLYLGKLMIDGSIIDCHWFSLPITNVEIV
jgi:hypothetical protein